MKRRLVKLATAAIVGTATLSIGGMIASAQSIPLDAAHFPDSAFRSSVAKTADKNNDGILTDAERATVKWVWYDPYEIDYPTLTHTFKGVEYLPNVKSFTCNSSDVTEIDLSQNKNLEHVECMSNHSLTTLNVSGCSKLKYLDCAYSPVQYLDLSGSPLMTYDRIEADKYKYYDDEDDTSSAASAEDDHYTCFYKNDELVLCCQNTTVIKWPDGSETQGHGHTYSETVTKQPTVTTEGSKTLTCTICGYVKQESIAKLTPTGSLSKNVLKIRRKKSSGKLSVIGMAAGDQIASVTSSKKRIVKVKRFTPTGQIILKAGKKKGKAKITVQLASGLTLTATVRVK